MGDDIMTRVEISNDVRERLKRYIGTKKVKLYGNFESPYILVEHPGKPGIATTHITMDKVIDLLLKEIGF